MMLMLALFLFAIALGLFVLAIIGAVLTVALKVIAGVLWVAIKIVEHHTAEPELIIVIEEPAVMRDVTPMCQS
jgi:hypothetical protein